jgi:hypothetical protein
MIHLNKVPLFPRKGVLEITMTPDGYTATMSFTARQFVPGVETADCARSTVGPECLTPEEQATYYALTSKMFESEESKRQLGADEATPLVPPEEEADA